MARTEAPLRMCMVTQELNEAHFTGWTDAELQAIRNCDPVAIGEVLYRRLFAADIIAEEWHCCIHDKDVSQVWDETVKDYVLVPKIKHFHCVMRFYLDDTHQGGTLSAIAAAIGIAPQYIEKAKRGANAWDNMVAYLIHIKYENKAQYSPDIVVSGGSLNGKTKAPLFRPYREIYNERRADWLKGRAKLTAMQAREDIDSLEEKILRGVVSKPQVLLTDELFAIYARYKRRCDDAFDTWQQRKITRAIKAFDDGEFVTTVYFITGRSGSGKSYFTRQLVKALQAGAKETLGQEWTMADCASSNPLDDYDGSEILVMDDLRGMAMTASDWLQLLDPERVGRNSARYHNKQTPCRAVIINSEKDALEFFYFLKGAGGGDRGEAMDQFFRRIAARVVVYRVGDTEERRVEIGEAQRVAQYELESPSKKWTPEGYEKLSLTYNFGKDPADMEYGEALARLVSITMARNKVPGASVVVEAGDVEEAGGRAVK